MRFSRITVAGLVVMVMTSTTLTAGTGDASAARARPDCNPGGLVVSQAPDGHVDACVRIGNLAPGPHTISLQDLLAFGPPPRKLIPPGLKHPVKPTPPPPEPAVRLTLSPDSGGPGTTVTVTGRLGKPFPRGQGHPNLCWDGCQNGLAYGDWPLQWTSDRTFRTTIVIPAAPWLEGGPPRVAPLVTGDYAIGIQCMRSARACSSDTEGAAIFHLRVTRPVAWCRTQATCARLTVSARRALPGQVVSVTGFAPLTAGPKAGTTYQVLVTRRRAHAPEFRFSARDGLSFATAGLGAVAVKAPPTYADLGPIAPLGEVSDGVPHIAADPADPADVAWCAGQTIAVEGPGGTTRIATTTVNTALRAMGFSVRYEPQPSCAAVAPLATSTGAPAGLVAAFYVTTTFGPPPSFLAALVTHDDGQTWTPIPVPRQSTPYALAGLRYAGATLDAMFALNLKNTPTAYPELDPVRTVSEVSSPDGQSWSEAPLSCPPVGPCVTLGPYFPGNCAMNGTEQLLLRSPDGGQTWPAPDFPYPVQACSEAQLVATSPTSELLVDSTSTYPVLGTTDGGATWHDIAIPKLPMGANIAVLPGGGLLVTRGLGYQGRWKLLAPGARQWCTVRTPSAAAQRRFQLAPVTAIGQTLWWLSGPVNNPDAAPAISQLPLSALSC